MSIQYLVMPYLKFVSITLLLLGVSCNQTSEKVVSQPNILFIFTDDHAKNAMSIYSDHLINTPNLDRIGKEGIVFNKAYVTNSICAPSRAVILTGRYSHLNGLRDNRDVFDGSQWTFPKVMQKHDYATALVGKWHLKSTPTGFSHYDVLIGQGDYYNPRMVRNGDTLDHIGYTTDLITDFALDFLKNRDADKPFMLMYQHKAPHRNWMPNTKHLDLFTEDLPIPETFYDDYANRSAAAAEQDMRISDMYLSTDMKLLPAYYDEETGTGGNKNFKPRGDFSRLHNKLTSEQRTAWDAHYEPINQFFKEANLKGQELLEWKYQRYIKDYLRCVHAVDENVGRLLAYLEQEGILDNTLIVYSSDQGFYLGEHGWYDKRFMYEESFGTPMVMRYPELIPSGTTSEALVMNLDLPSTFLDVAGIPVPATLQGRSLKPLFSTGHAENWRDAVYYHYYEYPHGWHDVKRHEGVSTGTHKLIHFYDDIDAWELFDLEKDPNEMKSVYDDPEYASIRSDLENRLEDLKKELKVPSLSSE